MSHSKRQMQFSIGSLLVLTAACATVARMWPRGFGDVWIQLTLCAWTVLTALQFGLLVWVWTGLTGMTKRQWWAVSLGLAGAIVAPVSCCLVMPILIAREMGAAVGTHDVFLGLGVSLMIFLSVATVLITPVTLFIYWGWRTDKSFFGLRCLSWFTSVGSVYFLQFT
jgi:hypothetical protein